MLNTRAPDAPTNILPSAGAAYQLRNPTLVSSSFSDPFDTHTTSQWQIATDSGFGNIVYDSGSVTNLVVVAPAIFPPDPSARYYWHVRHKDTHGMWSVWSATTWFDTYEPFVVITNMPPAFFPYKTLAYAVAGTNNKYVVGMMWATNTTAGGVRQVFAAPVSPASWWIAPPLDLVPGVNRLVVYGTNAAGLSASNVLSLTRGANVELVAPDPGTVTNATSLMLDVYYSAAIQSDQRYLSTNAGTSWFSYTNVVTFAGEGAYNWTAMGYDAGWNPYYATATNLLVIVTTPPRVRLQSPMDGSTLTNQFAVHLLANYGNATAVRLLSTNSGASWFDYIPGTPVFFPSTGTWQWTARGYDPAGNCGYADTTNRLTLHTANGSTQSIHLLAPAHLAVTTNAAVSFSVAALGSFGYTRLSTNNGGSFFNFVYPGTLTLTPGTYRWTANGYYGTPPINVCFAPTTNTFEVLGTGASAVRLRAPENTDARLVGTNMFDVFYLNVGRPQLSTNNGASWFNYGPVVCSAPCVLQWTARGTNAVGAWIYANATNTVLVTRGPNVHLLAPEHGTLTNATSLMLDVYYSTAIQPDQRYLSTNAGMSWFAYSNVVTFAGEGTYYWTAMGFDADWNPYYATATNLLVIVTNVPQVRLQSPIAGSTLTNQFAVHLLASYGSATMARQLSTNSGASWFNYVPGTPVFFPSTGTWQWTARGYTAAGTCGYADTTNRLTLDAANGATQSIHLLAPAHLAVTTNGTVAFSVAALGSFGYTRLSTNNGGAFFNFSYPGTLTLIPGTYRWTANGYYGTPPINVCFAPTTNTFEVIVPTAAAVRLRAPEHTGARLAGTILFDVFYLNVGMPQLSTNNGASWFAYAPVVCPTPCVLQWTARGTNAAGAWIYANATNTLTIAGTPQVDITNNPPFMVSWDTTTWMLGGTNNAAVAGTMWWWSDAANSGGSFARSGFAWTTSVALASAPTVTVNRIHVYGTNLCSQVASDTIDISVAGFGMGVPFLDITTMPATVSFDTTDYAVSGTNNAIVVGGMWVSNGANSAVAQFIVQSSWLTPALPLAVGQNDIWVYGTNDTGITASDSIVIIRSSIDPFVDITNADAIVSYETTTATIAGTNNMWVVGGLIWTNTVNGAWGTIEVTGDKFQVTGVPLGVGENVIAVSGTNRLGVVAADTVTVERLAEFAVVPRQIDFGTNDTVRMASMAYAGTDSVSVAIARDAGASWLSVSPSAAIVSNLPVSMVVEASRVGLGDGVYSCNITATPSVGAAVVVACRMVVAGNGLIANPGGPYVADQGSPVTLDGSASMGIGLRYRWEVDDFVSSISTANVRFAYIGYVPGTTEVWLTVRDAFSIQAGGHTGIVVRNVAPSANLGGPYTGTMGQVVQFCATARDPGTGDVLSIRWNFGDGTGWQPWQDRSATNTTHVYMAQGTYVLQCQAHDNYGATGDVATATVFIDVPNLPPIARATLGAPHHDVVSNFAGMHMTFILDGTGSTDDRLSVTNLYFDWREDVYNPYKPLLTDAQKHMIVLTNSSHFPLPGVYKYHLVVNDGAYNSAQATVQINVPGISGVVKAEGMMAELPVYGVTVTATNHATGGGVQWAVTDMDGRFVLDTGASNNVVLTLARDAQQSVRITSVDEDGVKYPELGSVLTFPARPCTLTADMMGKTGGVWHTLVGAHARVVIGSRTAYNGDSDLSGAVPFGGIPELYPRHLDHKVIYQKSGYESDIVPMVTDPSMPSHHEVAIDSSSNYIVHGMVVGTNSLPVEGVKVDFGPAFPPVLTAADGTFVISNMMYGKYYVQMSAEGFDLTFHEVTVSPVPSEVVLPNPLRIYGFRHSVYGEVLDANSGMPLANAVVRMVDTGRRKAYARRAATNDTGTTGTGYYDLPVERGTRTITISAPAYYPTTIVVNTETHVQQGIQLTPVPEPAIAGAMALCVGACWAFARRLPARLCVSKRERGRLARG